MIFFHVGLHKTGTTFLQKAVFPKWQGVTYIPWPNLELFLRLDAGKTYLVSREGLSGKNWAHHEERDASLKRLSEMFQDAQILISFRKHSGYITSSYRQYLQRGGPARFEQYFDLENDRGVMKREDFVFRRKLESIETHFGRRPFVFLHEELSGDLDMLLRDMEGYIGGKAPSSEEISRKRYNESVGYYPAQLLRRFNMYSRSELNPDGRYNLNHPTLQRLRLTPREVCRHWLSFLPNRPFLSREVASSIDEFYQSDWEFVGAYGADRRTEAGRPVSLAVT
jgi:hypothetical protein